MAPSCGISDKERYQRMAIGGAFVIEGFVLRGDAFAAISMVSVGSDVTAAAALGH